MKLELSGWSRLECGFAARWASSLANRLSGLPEMTELFGSGDAGCERCSGAVEEEGCEKVERYTFGPGLVARMKALRNLPWTCGAISSTAMPASLRNWRASSTS